MYVVETSYKKGRYKSKWTFPADNERERAFIHYNGLNVHSGYNKRMKYKGNNQDVIIARTLTYPYEK